MDQIQEEFQESKRDSETMRAFGHRLYNQFSTNKAYRRPKELQWLEDLRAYKGVYDPDVRIDPDNSHVYPKLTRSKVNIVLSRLHEMLFPDQDRNWELSPTPEPVIKAAIVFQIAQQITQPPPIDPQTGQVQIDQQTGLPMQPIPPTREQLNEAIKDFAKQTAALMQSEIDDQLTEMDYPEVAKKVLRSGLLYGTGILAGPLVNKRQKRRWQPDSQTNTYIEKVEDQDVPYMEFTRIWDWYPDMTVAEFSQAQGFWQRSILTKHDLRKLMKRPDFDKDIIRQILQELPDGDYVPEPFEVDLQALEVEASTQSSSESGGTTIFSSDSTTTQSSYRQHGKRYEAIQYWGYVDGSDLAACGILNPDGSEIDVDLEYAANVWLIGKQPVKVMLYDGALTHYKVFYYEKDETSIFGEGLARVMRHSQIAVSSAARMMLDNAACVCLTGDTEVYRQGKKVSTLRELSKRWDATRMKIRSLDESTGELFYNKINKVFNNGIKKVYEIKTASGYHIKATEDHRFMGDDGEWKELKEFCVDDLIAVNGTRKRPSGVCVECGKQTKGSGIRCRSCAMIKTHPPDIDLPKNCVECGEPTALRGVRCRKCASKVENSTWNMKQAVVSNNNHEASESTARQRWFCQKDKKDICERCGARADAGVRLCIHHKDHNPYNNDPSNKITLCQPCHLYIHRRYDHFGNPYKHKFVDYDKISSIEYAGEEEVFNLEMDGTNNNFIANGIISHNCGPQVEINWQLMHEGTDLNSFYPRKIWYRDGRGIEAQYPAVRVYNIDSHIEELGKISDIFMNFADQETCLPTWMIGDKVNNENSKQTSGRQAEILVSIKDVVKNFDTFTEQVMRDLYNWNMEFNPREDIKGDFQCNPRGVSSLVIKEIRMAALANLKNTMQPDDWPYIPRREFLAETLKAHDIKIDLRSEEEAQEIIAKQTDQRAKELAYAQLEAEVAYKRAQTAGQLTKAKKFNVEAEKNAIAPPETTPAADPRLQDAELMAKSTDIAAKNEQIRRDEEAHQQKLRQSEESHRLNQATTAIQAAHDEEIKERDNLHGMKMKEKEVEIKARQLKPQKAGKKKAGIK